MPARALLATCVALLAFAGNSLLTRLALQSGDIDAVSFAAVRLTSGAGVLGLLALSRVRGAFWTSLRQHGSMAGAGALFLYALPFSLAYVQLSAGVGALLLFGAVQVGLLAFARVAGEPLSWRQIAGLCCAFLGLIVLVRPGATAPPVMASLLMGLAGLSWAAYTRLSRGTTEPLLTTAFQFVRALPLVALTLPWLYTSSHISPRGLLLAGVSGALTSGLGYAVWYAALVHLRLVQAAVAQLAVPLLTALLATGLLREALSARWLVACPLVLLGIALASLRRAR